MVVSNCAICGNKNIRFIKNQEASKLEASGLQVHYFSGFDDILDQKKLLCSKNIFK